jgi:hypothetical protein
MAELADRVFCIYNEPAAAKGRGRAEARMAQWTLEKCTLGGPSRGHRPGALSPGGKSISSKAMELETARRSWQRSSVPGLASQKSP